MSSSALLGSVVTVSPDDDASVGLTVLSFCCASSARHNRDSWNALAIAGFGVAVARYDGLKVESWRDGCADIARAATRRKMYLTQVSHARV